MSAPKTSHSLVSKLGRLAVFGTALFLILAFKARASAQDKPAIPAAQAPVPPLNVSVVKTGTEVQRVQFEDGWVMEIRPEATSRVLVNGQAYSQVYESVPYRRTEYLANPSYRHDTTVELLAGELRPTVIHRNDTPVRVENPRPGMYRPYIPSASDLWHVTRYTLGYPFYPYSMIPPLHP